MNFSVGQFKDAHLHARSVQEWPGQTYNQITAGKLCSRLEQFSGARFMCFRERIDQRVVQQGEGPRGKVVFGVPLALPGALQVQGREADQHSLLVLWGGEEFMLQAPKNVDMISVSFDQPTFEKVLHEAPRGKELRQLLRNPVLRVSEKQLALTRQRLLGVLASATLPGDTVRDEATEQRLEAQLIAEMLDLVSTPECTTSRHRFRSTSGYIVEKVHRLAAQEHGMAPSVSDICKDLRVSRRTIQNAFHKSADTSPLHYIRSIRLNAVRRDLLSTRKSQLNVGDAAARWGFFHVGHFAADYRELFDEVPSQTPRLVDSVAVNALTA